MAIQVIVKTEDSMDDSEAFSLDVAVVHFCWGYCLAGKGYIQVHPSVVELPQVFSWTHLLLQ